MRKIGLVSILFLQLACMGFGQEVKVVSMPKYLANSLFNFSKQVNWPVDVRTGDFIFGIINDKNVYLELQALTAGKTIGTQNILIKLYKNVDEISGLNHILFISDGYSTSLGKIIAKMGTQSTLIVTEREGLTGNGAAISFIPVDGLMKFEVEKKNVEKYGLQVSAWLEKMAYKGN